MNRKIIHTTGTSSGSLSIGFREESHIEMDKLKDGPSAYNEYISNNLPFTQRYGKINRAELWDILGDDEYRFDKKLGEETVTKLKVFVRNNSGSKPHPLTAMTADTFFRICEIGYDANNYFRDPKTAMSPRDKYLSKADGRDAGLSKIDGNSTEEFYQWYHSGRTMGAHPWEICRGGNSTHISLYVFDQGARLVPASRRLKRCKGGGDSQDGSCPS